MDLKGLPLFAQPSGSAPSSPVDSGTKEPAPRQHLTVTELTSQIKSTVEPAFTNIWVQGEVSNYRPATSGHVYFSLKDKESTISVAAFGWNARTKKTQFELKDGLSILCHGKISLYGPRGSYQLSVDHMEPLGAGALQFAFEQLKEKLGKEGLFDQARKRPLPRFPTRIAVVTSPSGAAIQDMLNILHRRAPQIRVTVIPAIVQGDSAHTQIIRGIEQANRYKLGDVVILARGGGSIEDLWCFNHEELARAIAASKLPVISAVGHEIDFTISDFVSDLRAPTPSAAAELVSGHWVDAAVGLREFRARLVQSITRALANQRTLLSHITARVVSPRDRLREQAQRIDEIMARLDRAIRARLDRRRSVLEQLMGKLDALSPLRVLERGYAIVREAAAPHHVVRTAGQIKAGQKLEITFQDGKSTVESI